MKRQERVKLATEHFLAAIEVTKDFDEFAQILLGTLRQRFDGQTTIKEIVEALVAQMEDMDRYATERNIQ